MSDQHMTWEFRMIHRITLLLVAPFVPLIRMWALARWFIEDIRDCYRHLWHEIKKGEPEEWP